MPDSVQDSPPALCSFSIVVQLQTHAVVDLVVIKRDVILVDSVPLLDPDLLPPRARLRRDELLQVAHGVVLTVMRGRRRTAGTV